MVINMTDLNELREALAALKDDCPDECTKIVYEAAQAHLDSQWKPIESAPKDGSRFLAYEKKENASTDASCFECWWEEDYTIDEWGVRVGAWDDDWALSREPTHWVPLPTPPEVFARFSIVKEVQNDK